MANAPVIAVTRHIFPYGIVRLNQLGSVLSHAEDRPLSEDEIISLAKNAEILLVTAACQITPKIIQALPQLKLIANIGVGYNNVDAVAARAANVMVTNTPDVLTQATADLAWALLLSAARKVGNAQTWLRQGDWNRWALDLWLGAEVYGTTLGILGMGRIGQAIAQRALGFNMNVLYHNRRKVEEHPFATWVTKADLLTRSDHLIVVLPYSAETHHIIGASELASMKSTAVLVNIGRGGLVDDQALAAALKNKVIAAAGIDVFENEPQVHPDLLTAPNAVLTPHIGSATYQSRFGMMMLAIDNIEKYVHKLALKTRVI